MTPEDIKTDKRLRKKYGISLEEYNQMLESQGGKCAICFRPPVTRRLAVDHSHTYKYFKILTSLLENGVWTAWVAEVNAFCKGNSKKEVRESMKLILKRMSVRGLTCPHCNIGLRKFGNDPSRLISAGGYLLEFQARNKKKEN